MSDPDVIKRSVTRQDYAADPYSGSVSIASCTRRPIPGRPTRRCWRPGGRPSATSCCGARFTASRCGQPRLRRRSPKPPRSGGEISDTADSQLRTTRAAAVPDGAGPACSAAGCRS